MPFADIAMIFCSISDMSFFQFTPSAFVAGVTGVDNVCERAAAKASGGALLLPKTAGGGVTLALAVRPFAPDWRTEQ